VRVCVFVPRWDRIDFRTGLGNKFFRIEKIRTVWNIYTSIRTWVIRCYSVAVAVRFRLFSSFENRTHDDKVVSKNTCIIIIITLCGCYYFFFHEGRASYEHFDFRFAFVLHDIRVPINLRLTDWLYTHTTETAIPHVFIYIYIYMFYGYSARCWLKIEFTEYNTTIRRPYCGFFSFYFILFFFFYAVIVTSKPVCCVSRRA